MTTRDLRHHAHFPSGWISLAVLAFAALFLFDTPMRMAILASALVGYFVACGCASAVVWLGWLSENRAQRALRRKHLQDCGRKMVTRA